MGSYSRICFHLTQLSSLHKYDKLKRLSQLKMGQVLSYENCYLLVLYSKQAIFLCLYTTFHKQTVMELDTANSLQKTEVQLLSEYIN
jgi:hypothetical protein